MSIETRHTSSETMSLLAAVWSQAEDLRGGVARRLHDEQAGDLVALLMDLSLWQRTLAPDADVAVKFSHLAEVLDRAVRLNRELVEVLRPSLLDNVGLFAALRWKLQTFSRDHHLKFSSNLPDLQPALESQAALQIFRLVEDGAAFACAATTDCKALAVSGSVEGTAFAITVEMAGESVRVDSNDLALLTTRAQLASAVLAVEALPGHLNLKISCGKDFGN